jgi:hypothetical protein
MLSPPNGFKVFDALAASDSLDDRFFLFSVIVRYQSCDRPADDLLGGVAKNTLCAGVPARYDPIEVLAHDCVVT